MEKMSAKFIIVLEEKKMTDIEIAQAANMKRINEIALKMGLEEDDYEQHGKYRAKVELSVLKKNKDNKDGKLILVTAITPTPAGEVK